MKHERIPGLAELAFEGRNKAYGAYDLRKKYPRRLLISLLSGIFIISLSVMIPWLFYYFEPVLLIEGNMMYEVEYYSMIAPPDDEMNKMAQALSKPLQEAPQVPVVKDSIFEEKKPIEEPLVKDQENEKAKIDSSAKPGGSGLGTGSGDDTGLATSIDVYPRYPGGDESRLYYLRKKIKYPEAALKSGVQGVVMVVFIVETDGSLTNVDVTKRIGGGCDEEAMRVTKEMPRWEPGKRNGRAVRVMVRMPIVFRIPGRSS
ncbi:MAG: TonB family protein [Bacteroidota bacterium]